MLFVKTVSKKKKKKALPNSSSSFKNINTQLLNGANQVGGRFQISNKVICSAGLYTEITQTTSVLKSISVLKMFFFVVLP